MKDMRKFIDQFAALFGTVPTFFFVVLNTLNTARLSYNELQKLVNSLTSESRHDFKA